MRERMSRVEAIHMEDDKSVLDREKCIGCASCVAACPNRALFVDFKAGDDLQEKMVEYGTCDIRNYLISKISNRLLR